MWSKIKKALLRLLPLFLPWLAARLRERSTIAGAVGVLTAVGVNIEPEQIDAITTIGVGLSALFVVLPDRPGQG